MASCSAFGSTSEVSLFYTAEPDLDLATLWDQTLTWEPVPFTGESLSTNLTSTISDQITPQRSYAGSKLTQGEIAGAINYEAQAGDFMYDMVIAALQADKQTSVGTNGTGALWEASQTIKNGSTKHCFALLKRVAVASGDYDWYVFRGAQVSSLSLDISPNALITGSVNFMGVRPDTPVEDAAAPGGWTLNALPTLPLMSGVDSLKNFDIYDAVSSSSTSVTMQNVTINLDNQMRQQQAVGIDSIYAAGIASGRFMASYSGAAYYANPAIYNSFVNDTALVITGQLIDAESDGFQFDSGYVKVTSGSIPMAGGPDQDLMIDTEFRAYEDGTTGTIAVTRITV